MKILIKPHTFKAAWDSIKGIRAAKNTIEVLDNARLAITPNGTATLTVTNLDREGEARFEVSTDGAVDLLLPQQICDYIANFKQGEVALTTTDDGRIRASQGRSRMTVALQPATDFPAMQITEESYSFSLPLSEIMPILAAIAPAMGTEETRYYLRGIYMQAIDGALHFTAIDGHRLHTMSIDMPEEGFECEGVIIEASYVKVLLAAFKVDGETVVTISGNDRIMRFATQERAISGKLVDGSYPDWQRVVPTEFSASATFGVSDLADALKRIQLLKQKDTKEPQFKIVMDAGNGALLSADNHTEGCDAEDACAVTDIQGDGAIFKAQIRYFDAALGAACSDKITVHFDGSKRALLRDENTTLNITIMGVRI